MPLAFGRRTIVGHSSDTYIRTFGRRLEGGLLESLSFWVHSPNINCEYINFKTYSHN